MRVESENTALSGQTAEICTLQRHAGAVSAVLITRIMTILTQTL